MGTFPLGGDAFKKVGVGVFELRGREVAERRVPALAVVEDSMKSNTAKRAAALVGQERRWMSSALRVLKNASATALSYASPRDPIETSMPAARQRCPNRSETY